MSLIRNDCPAFGTDIPDLYRELMDVGTPATAREYFRAVSAYRATSLRDLSGMAAALNIRKLFYKDEGDRLGLQSFKALGGAYGVLRLVHRHLEKQLARTLEPRELLNKAHADYTRDFTVACATDGNHGRSVAWGAQLLGCPCVIFLHENVAQAREDAIAAFGATIVRVPGVYDDSCAEAARVAERNGWHVVSDFATVPYHQVTSWVMQGYTVMVDEILEELSKRDEMLTHIFVQGGCGGLAAAVAAHFHARATPKPVIVVVEPERANCLLQSARNRALSRIPVGESTCMAMLECYEPSHMAWPILERTAEFFMDIPDDAAEEMSRRLAAGAEGDAAIQAGASGVAGLAGLCSARAEAVRRTLRLSERSSVLVIGSEGLVR